MLAGDITFTLSKQAEMNACLMLLPPLTCYRPASSAQGMVPPTSVNTFKIIPPRYAQRPIS